MATSTTCPACGHQQPAHGSSVGPVICASCGQTYEPSAAPPTSRSSATKTAITSNSTAVSPSATPSSASISQVSRPPSIVKPATRPPGSPPELLDRLPKPFLTSPPMIAVGSVFVMLYGMVALGVVTNLNNRPDPEPLAAATPAFAPIGPAQSKLAEDAKKTSDTAPKPSDPDKAKPREEKPRDDKDNNERSGKTSSPGGDSKKPEPRGKAPDMALARVDKPAPALVPVKPEGPKPVNWGVLRGLPGDSSFRVDDAGMSVEIPGTLHILSPDPKLNNAPQLLTDAGGNFTATVKVVGRIQPGIVPLDLPIPEAEKPKEASQVPKFPITFQGAGLLVWQDPINYIRLERSANYFIANGRRTPFVLLEYYQNGQPGGKEVPAKDKESVTKDGKSQEREIDLTLRIIRIGAEFRCSYSPDDGKTWLEVKRFQAPGFPPVVKVGISATNVAAKSFTPRFEGFDLAAKAK